MEWTGSSSLCTETNVSTFKWTTMFTKQKTKVQAAQKELCISYVHGLRLQVKPHKRNNRGCIPPTRDFTRAILVVVRLLAPWWCRCTCLDEHFFGGFGLVGFIQTWFAHNVHDVSFHEIISKHCQNFKDGVQVCISISTSTNDNDVVQISQSW